MFSGRVVDVETSKPVEGASIVMVKSIPGVPPGAVSLLGGRDDDPDRCRRSVRWSSADQVAERRLSLGARINHPRYSPGNPRRRHRRGDRCTPGRQAFLERSPSRKGGVHGPDLHAGGEAGRRCALSVRELGLEDNRSHQFMNYEEGRTDDEGRFRLRMPKSQAVALTSPPPNRPARGSRMHPISTSGVRTGPPSIRMFGLRPTSAGSCSLGSPALGTDARPRRPADRRPDDQGLCRPGPGRALRHDRGRRNLLAGSAPPCKLLGLR